MQAWLLNYSTSVLYGILIMNTIIIIYVLLTEGIYLLLINKVTYSDVC